MGDSQEVCWLILDLSETLSWRIRVRLEGSSLSIYSQVEYEKMTVMSDFLSLLTQMKNDQSIHRNNFHEKLFACCVYLLEIYFKDESKSSREQITQDNESIQSEANLIKRLNQKLQEENRSLTSTLEATKKSAQLDEVNFTDAGITLRKQNTHLLEVFEQEQKKNVGLMKTNKDLGEKLEQNNIKAMALINKAHSTKDDRIHHLEETISQMRIEKDNNTERIRILSEDHKGFIA
jgi:uncharacterized protein YhaN